MIRVRCISNKGYKELVIGAEYFFDNFTAKSPFTEIVYSNLYAFIDGEYACVGLYPRNLFTIAD